MSASDNGERGEDGGSGSDEGQAAAESEKRSEDERSTETDERSEQKRSTETSGGQPSARSTGHKPDGGQRPRSSGDWSGGRQGARGSDSSGGRSRRGQGADALRHEADRQERKTPAGIERARRRPGVPPPRHATGPKEPVRKPEIPRSATVDLPSDVRGDLRRHAQHDDEVAKAVTIASDALEVGDVDRALEYLEWAKSDAPRSASVREALGIARYLAENWAGALTELQAYRRMSGRSDQNHLVADCLRALGRPLEMVAEAVKEMEIEEDGIDRVAEATIVWASALADTGDVAAGRAVLGRVLGAGIADMDPASEHVEEHHVRVWYVAGDLAERAGDREEAQAWFRRVATVDPELYDVEERLRR